VTRRRVLVVAMADSIHTARWLAQFRDEAIDVEVFPSTPHRRVHPGISMLEKSDGPLRVRLTPGLRYMSVFVSIADLLFADRVRRTWYRYRARELRPDVIHAMETQHAGYLLETRSDRTSTARVVLSVWGSDFVVFGRNARHRPRITALLGVVDRLVVECSRDEEFARSHGYAGPPAIRISASGGLDPTVETRPFTNRRGLLIKGYSGFMGMGPAALRAAFRSRELLRGHEVTVFSAGARTRVLAAWMRWVGKMEVTVFGKHALTHEQMLDLFGRSRVVIALSRSDGFPGVVREAAMQGTYLVHSETACLEDWIPNMDDLTVVDVRLQSTIDRDVRRGLERALLREAETEAATADLRHHAVTHWSRREMRDRAIALYRE